MQGHIRTLASCGNTKGARGLFASHTGMAREEARSWGGETVMFIGGGVQEGRLWGWAGQRTWLRETEQGRDSFKLALNLQRVCMYAHMNTSTHASAHSCRHAHMHACMHTHTGTCSHVGMHTVMCSHIHACAQPGQSTPLGHSPAPAGLRATNLQGPLSLRLPLAPYPLHSLRAKQDQAMFAAPGLRASGSPEPAAMELFSVPAQKGWCPFQPRELGQEGEGEEATVNRGSARAGGRGLQE